jgi:hypothetical protein
VSELVLPAEVCVLSLLVEEPQAARLRTMAQDMNSANIFFSFILILLCFNVFVGPLYKGRVQNAL